MATERIVDVNVEGASYKVFIRPGLLSEIGPRLREISQAKRVAIMTDSEVGPIHLPTVRDSLSTAGFAGMVAAIPAGEENKDLETLLPVYDAFLTARVERSTPIVAVGGGVVGDMAGFVAATLLRGVPFVQVPTTLLAMVDASVGGKTGVNHETGKNLIGAFHQPIAVFIDPETLQSLHTDELRNGLAECIKHDIIRDAEGFRHLEGHISRALSLDMDYLTDLIAHNVAIKAKVVAADPHEHGDRAHLNLGHTFGHAIETVTGYDIPHGEAVALGIVAAAHVAQGMGLLDDMSRRRIQYVLSIAGLPISDPELEPDDIIDAMASDKKVKDGRIRFVLPEGIGKATVRSDVPIELVKQAVSVLRG